MKDYQFILNEQVSALLAKSSSIRDVNVGSNIAFMCHDWSSYMAEIYRELDILAYRNNLSKEELENIIRAIDKGILLPARLVSFVENKVP